ncbi:MAG: SRPBCC family protein [Gammaproteobacteria bacterium]|nr:SRPBCC family protein [Gammaproteobacteria bacterium]
MKKSLLKFLGHVIFFLSLSPSVFAQDAEYVTIEMEIDINESAADVWEVVGEYCDIEEWGGLPCEVTSGNGGMGTVRELAFGPRSIIEILVAQTELSYGYTQPVTEGQYYNLYHGFMEARPVTADTSRMVYTLVYDVSNLENQEAKDADMARRRGAFEGMLQNMKEIAEAN